MKNLTKKPKFKAFFGLTAFIAVISRHGCRCKNALACTIAAGMLILCTGCDNPANGGNPCEGGHTFTVFVSTTAACTEAGQDTHKCSLCDETTQTARAALGHDHFESLVCKRTGCDHQYALGDTGPGGGKIFYIAPAGFTVTGYGSVGQAGYFAEYKAHYLEVAPENAVASRQQWGLDGTLITGLTSYANTDELNAAITAGVTGNGRKDTHIIIAELGTSVEYAARSASAYTTDSGHTDWFLPSVTELNLLYQSGSAISDMPPNDIFWSSSVSTGGMVWIQFFSDGYLLEQSSNMPVAAVRSVRAF